jgi:Fe-S-cluster containining protein
MKKPSEDELNKKLCGRCTRCCEYVNIRLDTPTTEEEFDNILWYLLHKDVYVWIGKKNKWYVKFNTPCKPLKKGRCKEYSTRPMLCREYIPKKCEKYEKSRDEKHSFHTREQFLAYLKKKKYPFFGFYEKEIR